MEPIITITLNPAIDKSTIVKAIIPEKKMRCASPTFEPGGGGVNVSRALKRLGMDSSAMYLAGGYSGKFYEQLLSNEGIFSEVIGIGSHTRENMIVVDETTNLQYRFGMPGPTIVEKEWKDCLKKLDGEKGVEYIIISGSVPNGIPDIFFNELANIARELKARLIVDTSGEPLRHALKEGVYMIKPNLGELSFLQGVEELSEEEAVAASKKIIGDGGCEVVVVSMGAAGAMLITKDEVHFSSSPAVKTKSTVGAGDSMLAGIVYALCQQKKWQDVLQMGIATGTATTMVKGTGLCKKEDVEKLFMVMQKAKH